MEELQHIGEIPVPVRYFDEASSINFARSTIYGLSTLWLLVRYILHRTHLWRDKWFENFNP